MAITMRPSKEWIVPFTVSLEEIRDSILVKETWRGEEDAGNENTDEIKKSQKAMAMQKLPLAGLEKSINDSQFPIKIGVKYKKSKENTL